MLVGLGEAVDLLRHVGDDPQAELLRLVALAMVLATEGDQALGKADEADGEGALVDDGLDGVVVIQFLGTQPEAVHQERELLLESGLLEVEALVQLAGGDFQGPVELLEELLDAEVLVLLFLHGLDAQLHDVDRGEGQVAAADGGLGTELIVVKDRLPRPMEVLGPNLLPYTRVRQPIVATSCSKRRGSSGFQASSWL